MDGEIDIVTWTQDNLLLTISVFIVQLTDDRLWIGMNTIDFAN
jgi:hypothetical protein